MGLMSYYRNVPLVEYEDIKKSPALRYCLLMVFSAITISLTGVLLLISGFSILAIIVFIKFLVFII